MNSKLIFLVLALLSFLLALRLIIFFANYEEYPEGTVVSFVTQVQSQPKDSIRGQQIWVNFPNTQRVLARLPLNPKINYGDKIRIEGRVRYFKATSGDSVASIAYPRFEILKRGTDSNFIYKIRKDIVNLFNSSLNSKYSSLVLGITFGIKQEMPADFYDQLQKVGLLHVIAASGMNITMVGGFLLSMFSLFLKRQLALILAMVGIIFYAFMAGFEASIVRASIMGILVFSAQLTGRQNSSFLALFMAGFLMLFKSPNLIYDIGFQLSFMATLGLIYFRPIFFLNHRAKTILAKSFIGDDLITTISAQVFTLPILLVNFGSYSLISVLVNAIVLWTVPIIMIVGGLSAIVGIFFEPLGYLLSYLSIPFLLYFENVVRIFSNFGSKSDLSDLPVLIIAGYYLILLSIVLLLRKKE